MLVLLLIQRWFLFQFVPLWDQEGLQLRTPKLNTVSSTCLKFVNSSSLSIKLSKHRSFRCEVVRSCVFIKNIIFFLRVFVKASEHFSKGFHLWILQARDNPWRWAALKEIAETKPEKILAFTAVERFCSRYELGDTTNYWSTVNHAERKQIICGLFEEWPQIYFRIVDFTWNACRLMKGLKFNSLTINQT